MKVLHAGFVTWLVWVLGAAAHAAPPPVSVFLGDPQIDTLKISPSGKFIALTKRSNKYDLLNVFSYPELKPRVNANLGKLWRSGMMKVPYPVIPGGITGIADFAWVNDSRLLIELERRFPGYRAYKVKTGELVTYDVERDSEDVVFGYTSHKDQTGHIILQRRASQSWGQYLDFLPDDPESVLIHVGDLDDAGKPIRKFDSVQKINVRTGSLARVARAPVGSARFITDSNHQVKFAWGFNDKWEYQAYAYTPAENSWKLLIASADTEGRIWPFEQISPGEILAFDSTGNDTDRLIAWEPATNGKRELFSSETSDLRIVGVDPSNHVYVYGYTDHYPEYWYPDKDHPLARAHRLVREIYTTANVRFTSVTRDMSYGIAEVSGPRLPATYFMVDVKNLKLLQKFPSRPDINNEDLSPTDPIELTVRDGMKIRGFLTTPKGSGGKNLPMVVYVHGGPHSLYDRYDFDPEIQMLASRGYAVMQVNYRGSGGRGRAFEAAGYGRWGREMQDDVTDAVKWAITSGIADRGRICIFGESYGAYSALTGAFREPDLFRCAVGVSGIYDLALMYEKGDIRKTPGGVRYLERVVGTDMDELQRRSPVYNADRIKARVMLVHGKEDERAPIEHAERMRNALTKAGKPPVWLTESKEDHGIVGEENRTKVWEAMLEFFAQSLGAS